MSDHFDVILIGTGFASSFFLHGLLNRPKPPARILVLEAGPRRTHRELLDGHHIPFQAAERHFTNHTPHKPWYFTRAFGGGTNCWYGVTPRMLPRDFKLRSTYGVGADWPLSYDELEPHYTAAERLMAISGESPMPYPMSAPYPLPPHRFSEPDTVLKAAYPDRYFHLPTARASQPTGSRGKCCNNGVCHLCPIDAKFTIANGLESLFAHPSVTVRYEAPVQTLNHSADVVTGVTYAHQRRTRTANADQVVLGANALFNPFLLLRSGLDHPQTGVGLQEQVGVMVTLTLAPELQNFHGSTVSTGMGFNDLLDGPRDRRGGFIYHTDNAAMDLSLEPGREFSRLRVLFMIEDLRREDNRVTVSADGSRPEITYNGHSDYAQRTVGEMPSLIEKTLAPLPVEKIERTAIRGSEAHIQGTTVMGDDPATSVVDKRCVHHRYRNLLVLGSGTFPTASPANPSLTISALSLHAAAHA